MQIAVIAGTVGLAVATLSPAVSRAGFNAPYVGSYLYSGKLDSCISGAKAALQKHGYRVDEVVSIDDGKGAIVYASHTSLALGATIECDPSRGKGSWGVAGPNDRDAFESFKQIGDESW
ncbi:MAG: hypothetical protein ACKO5M_02450 [Vulcanococcus sp.]